jgi:hypothetical protein
LAVAFALRRLLPGTQNPTIVAYVSHDSFPSPAGFIDLLNLGGAEKITKLNVPVRTLVGFEGY